MVSSLAEQCEHVHSKPHPCLESSCRRERVCTELIQGGSVNGCSIALLTFYKIFENAPSSHLLKVGHRKLLSCLNSAGCKDRLRQRGRVESVLGIGAAGVVQPGNYTAM